MKGILGIPAVDTYTLDMCSNGRCPHVYGLPLSARESKLRMGERCPNCGTQRYVKRNSQLSAARRCVLVTA